MIERRHDGIRKLHAVCRQGIRVGLTFNVSHQNSISLLIGCTFIKNCTNEFPSKAQRFNSVIQHVLKMKLILSLRRHEIFRNLRPLKSAVFKKAIYDFQFVDIHYYIQDSAFDINNMINFMIKFDPV